MALTVYGDIQPALAGHISKIDAIKHNIPKCIIDQFGQPVELPERSTQTIIFEGFDRLDPTPTPVTVEGVRPTGKKLTPLRIQKTLQQYADIVEITDIIDDTHPTPVLSRCAKLCGDQFVTMMEIVKFGAIKAGTNAVYANGMSRAEVNSSFSRAHQSTCLRGLMRQDADVISERLAPSPNFNTEPVPPCYVAMCHTDLIPDIEAVEGFTSLEKYSSWKPLQGEFGKIGTVRYCASTVFKPWADAGAASTTMLSTGGTKADVYPIIYVGKWAYGHVALRGQNVFTPMVLKPNVPRGGDELGQKGSCGWKTMQGCVILNDYFMVRLEVAAKKYA